MAVRKMRAAQWRDISLRHAGACNRVHTTVRKIMSRILKAKDLTLVNHIYFQ
jgi:hypothetical protein